MMKIDERLIQLETERSLLEKKRKELAEEERRMLRVRKIYPDVFMSKLADGTPCFMSHTVKAPSMVELDKAGTIKTFITVSSPST